MLEPQEERRAEHDVRLVRGPVCEVHDEAPRAGCVLGDGGAALVEVRPFRVHQVHERVEEGRPVGFGVRVRGTRWMKRARVRNQTEKLEAVTQATRKRAGRQRGTLTGAW